MERTDFEIAPGRADEVMLFDIIPKEDTAGTAYDYARQFPGLHEELYYLLECATRQNADPEKVVQACREVVEERNQELLNSFEGAPPGEANETLDIDQFLYEQNPNISQLKILECKPERDSEQQPDILLHEPRDTSAGQKYDNQNPEL